MICLKKNKFLLKVFELQKKSWTCRQTEKKFNGDISTLGESVVFFRGKMRQNSFFPEQFSAYVWLCAHYDMFSRSISIVILR